LPELVRGVFATPFRRTDFAAFGTPHATAILHVLPILLLLRQRAAGATSARGEAIGAAAVAAYVVFASARDPQFYRAGWFSAWALLFAVVVMAVGALRTPRVAVDARGSLALTLAIVAVCCALVEFPFAAPIYTLYAIPLTFLALVGLVRWRGGTPPLIQAVVVGCFLAFGLVRILPGSVESLGRGFARSTETSTLDLARGGLRIRAADAATYQELIDLIQTQHDGGVLWAGPDAPEVYFLSGMRNHTRTLFDFLGEPAVSAASLVERVHALGASTVVLNLAPGFSPPPPPQVVDSLVLRYPHRRDVGDFVVLWR
jgi:hypothetical protein